MRSSLAAAVLVLLACTSVHATSSLSFEADGYLVDIVVGDAAGPVVSGLSIAMPGSRQPITLPMRLVKVDVFETRQRALLLSFSNPGDSTLPESFRLTVQGDAGLLAIGKRSLSGRFSWGM